MTGSSPRAQAIEDRIDWLSDQPLVKFVARFGERFGIDPIVLLRDEGDPFLNEVRQAALRVIAADDKAREDASKSR